MKDRSNLNTPVEFENIFKNRNEYLTFFSEALSVLRGTSKKVDSISNLIPKYVEVDFNYSINRPRLYFPKENHDTVIAQLPIPKKRSREKDSIREHKLLIYSAIKGKVEVAIVDEFAMRFKLLDKTKKNPLGRKK